MKNLKSMWATTKAASVEKAAETNKGAKALYATAAAGSTAVATLASVPMVFAGAAGQAVETFTNTIGDIFREIGGAVIGISSAVAVALTVVCLLIRMLSKNPKAAEEATSWMKRIVITWFCIMIINLLFTIGQDLANDVDTTGNTGGFGGW